MLDEQWLDLLDNLRSKFELEEEKIETISKDDLGKEMINEIERVTFETPEGKIKLERVSRPLIVDKKVHYSHTAGTKGLVEYILSPTEKTHKVTIFKENKDGEWEELDIRAGGFKF